MRRPDKFPYAKPVYAGAVAFLGALVAALSDDTVTGAEWVTIASATVVAVGAVYGVTGTEAGTGTLPAPAICSRTAAGRLKTRARYGKSHAATPPAAARIAARVASSGSWT